MKNGLRPHMRRRIRNDTQATRNDRPRKLKVHAGERPMCNKKKIGDSQPHRRIRVCKIKRKKHTPTGDDKIRKKRSLCRTHIICVRTKNGRRNTQANGGCRERTNDASVVG